MYSIPTDTHSKQFTKVFRKHRRKRTSDDVSKFRVREPVTERCDFDHCSLPQTETLWGKHGKHVNYACEQSRSLDDARDHGPLGRDAGYRLSGSDASDDERGTRLLSEDGAGMRIIHDAVQSFLLPGTAAQYRRESGNYLLSDPAI